MRAAVTSTVVCLKPLGTVRRQDGLSAGGVTERTGADLEHALTEATAARPAAEG